VDANGRLDSSAWTAERIRRVSRSLDQLGAQPLRNNANKVMRLIAVRSITAGADPHGGIEGAWRLLGPVVALPCLRIAASQGPIPVQ
jgi:hypothetical protein